MINNKFYLNKFHSIYSQLQKLQTQTSYLFFWRGGGVVPICNKKQNLCARAMLPNVQSAEMLELVLSIFFSYNITYRRKILVIC